MKKLLSFATAFAFVALFQSAVAQAYCDGYWVICGPATDSGCNIWTEYSIGTTPCYARGDYEIQDGDSAMDICQALEADMEAETCGCEIDCQVQPQDENCVRLYSPDNCDNCRVVDWGIDSSACDVTINKQP